ncbi:MULTISPECIES: cardiolipin synthase [Brevibacterium]|uniref:cardiolipin synthase n=1 Tax=Brevibacterium TaxID=1696 RepID=UPI00227DE899|nr:MULTISPECIES: cardiolipin synthase [Brevibacterium]WAL39808.1 cardiolipin synthase [Brevibacterium sp. BRM-1]
MEFWSLWDGDVGQPWWRIALFVVPDLIIRIVALGVIPYRRKPTVALGWLMAIFLNPYAGLIAFLLFGSAKLPRRRRERQRAVNELIKQRTGDTALIGRSDHLIEPLTTAARLNYSLGALPMTHGNGVELIADNHACIARMAAEVDGARHTVHFEFYIVALDDTTRPLIDALLRAHARGVQVRILIDHIGSVGYPGYSELVGLLNDAGVAWRRSLPVRPWRGEYQRPDLRNHRKILVIDGAVAYTGSLNVIDRSYNKRRNRRKGYQWKDLGMRVTGPMVTELDAVFASDWYSETGDIIADEVNLVLEAPESGGLLAQVVPSGPGFELENNLRMFNHLIYNANRQVVICSPYFVPDESLLHALVTESHSGVDIRIYVGATSDHAITQKAQESYYDELVDAGVRIFRYPAPTVLHSKFLIIDDDVTIIGSSNMDERSFAMNLEVSMLIVDEGFAAQMYALEDRDYRPVSPELDLQRWRRRPWYLKYAENVSRLTSSLL